MFDAFLRQKQFAHETLKMQGLFTFWAPLKRNRKTLKLFSLFNRWLSIRSFADIVVQFCGTEPVGVVGKTVSIIFNGSKTEEYNTAECVCQVVSTGGREGYRMSAPDLRLQSLFGDCSSEAEIVGLNETNITCSTSLIKMGFVERNSSQLQLSFKSKPEFIWIQVQAKGESKISVNCSQQKIMQNVSSIPATPAMSSPQTKESTTTSLSPSSTTNTTISLVKNSTTLPLTTSDSSTTSDSLTSSSSHPPSVSYISMTPAATTAATTTEFNQSDKLAASGLNSNDFPVVAVIIPGVLLVGTGVGIVVWLKWRRRQNQTKKPVKDCNQEYQNQPSSSVQNKTYDNKDQLLANDLPKTADNYIGLDQENAYTYIDHEDAKAGLGASNDSKQLGLKAVQLQDKNYYTSGQRKDSSFNKGNKKSDTEVPAENDYTGTYDIANISHSYSVLEPQASTKAVDKNSFAKIKHETDTMENHNYFVLEPQNKPAAEDTNNKKPTEHSQSDNVESHNYFVLEPQHTTDAKPKPPKMKETSQVYSTEKQNHNYFVLEPHNTQVENSEPPKTNQANMSDLTQAEKAQLHNYMVLEPQVTYSSIDPDDVVVQTLPENEYNMINMKGKPVSRDPNYATLKTVGQTGKDVEVSDEYSHIQNNSNRLDMNEYSHTKFKNMKPHDASATAIDDCCPTQIKPSGVLNDEKEYSYVEI